MNCAQTKMYTILTTIIFCLSEKVYSYENIFVINTSDNNNNAIKLRKMEYNHSLHEISTSADIITYNSIDITTQLPDTSTDIITHLPDASADIITQLPDTSTDITHMPDTSTDIITHLPDTSADIITQLPDTSTAITHMPDTSTDIKTHLPETTTITDITTQLPDILNASIVNTNESNNELNNILNDEKKVYSQSFQTFIIMKKYVLDPIIMCSIFIVGFVSNSILLVILLRHEEMRTQSNVCIFSMALGDMLSVIVNVPVFYAFLASEKWTVGVIACKLMWFSSDFAVGLSIFSVTILSVQRYHGIVRNHAHIRNKPSTIRSRLATIIYIAFIWILSFGFAFRTAITANITNNTCSSIHESYGPDYPKNFAMLNLFIFCIIPLCVIAVFYTLTAIHLVKSSRNVPGEVSATINKQINARKKGARIVLALAGVFFISYVPWYTWQVIFFWGEFHTDIETTLYTYTLLYYLFFGNLCFNTIALYCVSSTFRKYFNLYLFCRKEVKESKVKL